MPRWITPAPVLWMMRRMLSDGGAKSRLSGNVDGGIVAIKEGRCGDHTNLMLGLVWRGLDEGHALKAGGRLTACGEGIRTATMFLEPLRWACRSHSCLMDKRTGLACLAFLLKAGTANACTVFKSTHDGRTFIGCNEDAWSINAQVRFVEGRNGDYGAIYFDHFNGHPLREMGPQLGMNEAGLVFDGLTIQPHQVTPVPGRQQVRFDDLMPMLMRTCATVKEAEARMRVYDFSWLTRSMLFFADRNGGYLIVENDTMIMGHDPSYAVGNWRMGTCSDPATIPIPRLQVGRELLLSGIGGSFEEAEKVLSTMTVCRPKLGEGTLYSVLFDPAEKKAHLYFYHDFSERITFDLEEELAKGDRTLDMASLFGARPEYDRLKSYLTPFHQRWLFWTLFSLAVLALILGAINLVQLMVRSVSKLRTVPAGRRGRSSRPVITPLLSGLACAVLIALIGVLLMQEGVYYFGLGSVHPALAWAPLLLALLGSAWLWVQCKGNASRRSLMPLGAMLLSGLCVLVYWDMLLPW